MNIKPLTYLAIPYSHPDKNVQIKRFQIANIVAGRLMKDGLKIFSPISHTHPIAEVSDLPRTWDYWRDFDKAYLEHSNKLIVITIDGWKESKGVTGEIEIANELGIPIEYYDYKEEEKLLKALETLSENHTKRMKGAGLI